MNGIYEFREEKLYDVKARAFKSLKTLIEVNTGNIYCVSNNVLLKCSLQVLDMRDNISEILPDIALISQ
jgi:hypothetical protein